MHCLLSLVLSRHAVLVSCGGRYALCVGLHAGLLYGRAIAGWLLQLFMVVVPDGRWTAQVEITGQALHAVQAVPKRLCLAGGEAPGLLLFFVVKRAFELRAN